MAGADKPAAKAMTATARINFSIMEHSTADAPVSSAQVAHGKTLFDERQRGLATSKATDSVLRQETGLCRATSMREIARGARVLA